MAQYHLNQRLLFDDETFQIASLAAPHTKIKLSATAARCLTLFIERQGETIDKETLMHECWGKYGALVTEGSMWKNISQLRQAFQKLNIPYEVIVTVPRLGYTFSSQVQVEKQGSHQEPAVEVTESANDASTMGEISHEPAPPTIIAPPQPRRRSQKIGVLIAGLLILNLLLAAGFYFYQSQNQQLGAFDISEQYLPAAPQGETQVYLQTPLNAQSAYVQAAMARFNHDKPRTLAGNPVAYLYLNKASSRSIYSYFICDRPMVEKDNGCSAYLNLQNETGK